VLHDGRDKRVLAVGQGVSLGLDGIIQKPINQDGPLGRDLHRRVDIMPEHFLIVHDFHAAPAQHERGPDHDRVADLFGNAAGFREAAGHARRGHRDVQLLHHLPEPVAVLRQVNHVGGGAENPDAGGGQVIGQVQGRLAAKLDDDPFRLLLFVNGKHVLQGQRLEVELVRGVIVRGYRFRVAVDHDRLVARVPQGKGGMHAAVIKLDALPDAVGPAAQHHDLLAARSRHAVGAVIGRVVVRGFFDAADRQGVPGFRHPELPPLLAQARLVHPQQPGQVAVGEAVLFGLDQERVGREFALVRQQLFLQVHQFLHLLDEPRLEVRLAVQLVHRRALAQRFVHDPLPLAARLVEQQQEFGERFLVVIAREAQAIPPILQRADRLLKGLLVGLANAHHLAHRAHLRPQLVLRAFELLERPPCEFHHHVIARGGVFLQRAVAPVGDFVQREAGGQLGRDQRNGQARGLGRQRRRPRRARIDLDDHHAPGPGIVRELDVGAPDHANRLDDPVGQLLQPGLQPGINRQHRRHAIGIPRMHAHRIHVLDEAGRDHLIFGVAHHLQLQLLPAHHGFLHQDLPDDAGIQPAAGHQTQLLHVIDMAAAGAAHGVGRANDQRVAQLRRHPLRLLHAERRRAPRHFDPQLLHRLLEDDAILALLDRVGFHADHAHAILGQHARFGELGRKIQPRLPSQVGQQGVRPLLFDDLRQRRHGERLDIRRVRHARIRHNGRGIGVHQHDLKTQAAQGFARLGAGIIKFARLADHDRAGANDKHFPDVGSSRHKGRSVQRNGWIAFQNPPTTARSITAPPRQVKRRRQRTHPLICETRRRRGDAPYPD